MPEKSTQILGLGPCRLLMNWQEADVVFFNETLILQQTVLETVGCNADMKIHCFVRRT